MIEAIVLGLGVNGLAVVRALGSKGVKVAGVYSDRFEEIGYASKYLVEKQQISAANRSDLVMKACLKLRGNQPEPIVIICTSDAYASVVAENQDEFSKFFTLTVPSSDLYWKFLEKKPTAKICIENNFPIPKTALTDEPGTLLEKVKDYSFPVIIKPNLTFGSRFPGKNVIAQNLDDVKLFLEEYPDLESDVVVQEIVPSGDGKIFVVSAFCDGNGKVQAIYSGKKIRQYLPDYGVTSYGVSVNLPELKEMSKQFLEAIEYKGFGTLEFAFDEEEQAYYFIELNIRTFYHNQLFKDAGVDLNYIGYLFAKDCSANVSALAQKDGVRWMDFTRDLGSFLRKRKQGRITFYGWIKDVIRARSFAYFNWSDLKPFMVSIQRLFSIFKQQF